MGGNALNIYTRRYKLDEYNTLCKEIVSHLNALNIKSYIAPSFKNKKDFGDLDILIYNENLNDFYNLILNEFKPQEIYANNPVYSFDYKDFQIDFILTKLDEWETSKSYYSYNDLGNLMGRIANNMGFRLGHYGLAYKQRIDNHQIKQFIVSRDLAKIFDFLGFNYQQFLNGFNSKKEIFDYVINSKYFNKSIYAYENLDNRNRTRNKKRVTYKEFLIYISNIDVNEYVYQDLEYYLTLAEDMFENIHSNIRSQKIQQQKIKDVRNKFNGNTIIKEFQIEGSNLNIVFNKFKSDVGEDKYLDYILKTDINDIIARFKIVNRLT